MCANMVDEKNVILFRNSLTPICSQNPYKIFLRILGWTLMAILMHKAKWEEVEDIIL